MSKRFSFTLVILLSVVVVTSAIVMPEGLYAKPWWWVQFSKGDDNSQSPNGFAKWVAFFANSASDTTNGGAGDTVYLTSFTWGSAANNHVPVTGIAGDNSIGVNAVYTRRAGAGDRNVRVIGDADDATWPPAGLNAGIGTSGEAGVGTTHNKISYVSSRGVITGSANMTDNGGFSAQPNNMILFKAWAVPDLMTEYRDQLDEMFAGTFGDATKNNDTFEVMSVYGDTVEVYFSDDNSNVPPNLSKRSNGTDNDDMQGVLTRLALNAKESIFYAFNRPQLDADGSFNTYFDALIAFNDTVAGVAQQKNEGVSPKDGYTRLSADHTCRNADDFYVGEMHHKFQIFDMSIVATGSPNHTRTALEFNNSEENLVVIHDTGVARRYMMEWHRVMQRLNTNPNAGGDIYETSPPAPPTNLSVTPNASDFTLTWTAPANPGDFSRYYIFVSDTPIYTNREIGDMKDDDGDGYIDEDPWGDWDEYKSGSSTADDTLNDDDADGKQDEDPWLYPEVTLLGPTPAAAGTSATVSTYNVHDPVQTGTNYWFAIVAVDRFGNESVADTAGPFNLGGVTPQLNITKPSDVVDSGVFRGDTPVTVFWLNISSDSANDSLKSFKVVNTGSADSNDIQGVFLYHDANADSRLNPGDTLVAELSPVGGKQWENLSFADSIPNGGGDSYIIVVKISDTATIGDTLRFEIPALGIEAVFADSGPGSALTNNGVLTIQSASQIAVDTRIDFPDTTVNKGETVPVLSLRVSVVQANDTLTSITIQNQGSMTNSDIGNISLYEDAGSDNLLGGADTRITDLVFTGSSTWEDTQLSYVFTGTTLDLLVAIYVSPSATGGNTFQGQVPARTLDTQKGDSGPTANLLTSATISLALDTAPDTSIVINEALPNPSQLNHDGDNNIGDAFEEYVELYNNSDGNVDLSGWDIGDAPTAGDATFPANLVLGPREFLVVWKATDALGNDWYHYSSDGKTVKSSGTFSAGAMGTLTNNADSVILRDGSDVTIDIFGWDPPAIMADDNVVARLIDGWSDSAVNLNPTPGLNSDTVFVGASPNGSMTVVANPDSILLGGTTQLTMTVKDSLGNTVTSFTLTADISISTGTISPIITGSFAAGTRNDIVTVSGITSEGSTVITVSYNTTTSGTDEIFVSMPPPADNDGSGTMALLENGVPVVSDTQGETAQYLILFQATKELSQGTVTFIIPATWSALTHDTTQPGYYTVSSSQGLPDSFLESGTTVHLFTPATFNPGDTIAILYGATGGAIVGSETPAVFSVWSADSNTATGPSAFADSVGIGVVAVYNVSGTVFIEGRSSHWGATISLFNGTDTFNSTSDTSGTFLVQVLVAGSYNLQAKESRTLAITLKGVAVSADTDLGTLGTLELGDALEDNRVNILDASLAKINISSGSDTRADLDNDGNINNTDIQFIRSNFGRIGQK